MREVWLSYNAVPERPHVSVQLHSPAEPVLQHRGPGAEHESEEAILEVILQPQSLRSPLAMQGAVTEAPTDTGAERRSLPHGALCEFLTHGTHEHHKMVVASHH